MGRAGGVFRLEVNGGAGRAFPVRPPGGPRGYPGRGQADRAGAARAFAVGGVAGQGTRAGDAAVLLVRELSGNWLWHSGPGIAGDGRGFGHRGRRERPGRDHRPQRIWCRS